MKKEIFKWNNSSEFFVLNQTISKLKKKKSFHVDAHIKAICPKCAPVRAYDIFI